MASFLATPVATTLVKWGCIGGSLGLGGVLMEPNATCSDFFSKPIVSAVTTVALRALLWYGGFWTILGGLLGWAGAAETSQKEKVQGTALQGRVTLGAVLAGLTIGYIIGNIF